MNPQFITHTTIDKNIAARLTNLAINVAYNFHISEKPHPIGMDEAPSLLLMHIDTMDHVLRESSKYLDAICMQLREGDVLDSSIRPFLMPEINFILRGASTEEIERLTEEFTHYHDSGDLMRDLKNHLMWELEGYIRNRIENVTRSILYYVKRHNEEIDGINWKELRSSISYSVPWLPLPRLDGLALLSRSIEDDVDILVELMPYHLESIRELIIPSIERERSLQNTITVNMDSMIGSHERWNLIRSLL